MTDEMQTHDDAETEQFLTREGVKYEKFDDRLRFDQRLGEMRDSLGEYVEAHTPLSVPDYRRIDNEKEKDGYLHTAERFTHESLDDDEFITVYTNQVEAFVALEQITEQYRAELIDERQVSYDDEQTLDGAVAELLQ